MNKRHVAYAGFLTLGLLLLFGRVPGGLTAEDAADSADLAVQLAEARLKMAEANLKRAARTNQRVANAVPAEIVKLYAHDVQLARHQFAMAKAPEAGDPFALWLERAAAEARLAEDPWQRAVAANRRTAGTVDELDLERLRLRADVARLLWARGKEVAGKSTEEKLAWQSEFLYDQTHRLKLEILQTAPSGKIFLRWWY